MIDKESEENLLEGNESRRVCSSDTRSPVFDWFVRDRELRKVVSNHLWSDFDLVKNLSVVYTDDRADHLWNNNHVSKMRLDWCWLLVGRGILLGLSQLLDQSHWLSLESSLELSSGTSMHDVHQLFGGQVK